MTEDKCYQFFNAADTLYFQVARLEEAHLKLREQFDNLRTLEQIVTHISDGLLFIDLQGKISLYNQAAAKITELPQEGVLGSPFCNIFSDALFGFSLSEALKTGEAPGRIDLDLSNGKEIEVAPTYIPGRGLLILLNDRTPLKQLERCVQHGDRLKELGEMAATLAHEIRNPLGGIEGFASLLKRELKNPAEQRMIDAILEGSRALNALVTNVLEYARPLTLHFVPTNLSLFLEETAELSQAAGYPCKVTVEKERRVSIDPKRMQLVLLNLIRNAREAGSARVEIVLTEMGTIQVRDRGEGIPPDQLEKIFTPFFTTKATGTGLGLSEAAKVMRAHGGTITVDSKVGKGTCITLNYAD